MNEYRNPGERFGVYEIDKELGRGAMGVVLLARDTETNQNVALKMLGAALDEARYVAAFKREAAAVERLDHPNIAKLLDSGQKDKLAYNVYAFIDGITWRDFLERVEQSAVSRFDLGYFLDDSAFPKQPASDFSLKETRDLFTDVKEHREAALHSVKTIKVASVLNTDDYINFICKIAVDAAAALGHAHRQGVYHRDVKPANLMIDRDGVAHLIDFGIARYQDDYSLSNTGAILGTSMYMSPEHITGRVNIEGYSDVFSLGIMLYESLTLEKPYAARTAPAIMHAIASKQLTPLNWKNRAVPPELAAIIHKATAKDPDHRFRSGDDLADELRRFLAGEKVESEPYSHRLDGREISASRPFRVQLAAIFNFLHFLLAMLLLPAFVDNELNGQAQSGRIAYTALFCCVGLSYFVIGRGALLGHRRAVYASTIYSVFIIVYLIYNIFLLDLSKHESLFPFFIILTVSVFNVYSIIALSSGKTREWLARCMALRAEYTRPVEPRRDAAMASATCPS